MIIDIGQKKFETRVLFTEQVIKERIWQLAGQINRDYSHCDSLVVLIVLNGAILFGSDLIRFIHLPSEIESIRLKSYHGVSSIGKVELLSSVPEIKGRHVLIVEDIVDSGRSVNLLKTLLVEKKPASFKVATLLDKPSSHASDLVPDYVGFEIGPEFVIGYGLDLDGKYRNLPYIASLHEIGVG